MVKKSKYHKNCPRKTALKDIALEVKTGANYKPTTIRRGKTSDEWMVTWGYIDNKEQRRLNRELGLWGINKGEKKKKDAK